MHRDIYWWSVHSKKIKSAYRDWCVSCRHSAWHAFLWIQYFDARCSYAYSHIEYRQWYINQFYSRICQHHVANLIHSCTFMVVIIYFQCCICRLFLYYFCSKTNQMRQCIKFIYFGMTLYMFRTVFWSIIKSSGLYVQQQAFVKQILLSAC